MPRPAQVLLPLSVPAARTAWTRTPGRHSPEGLREALLAGIRAEAWKRLESDALRIARHFRLTYSRLEPERKGVRSRYGVTFSDGTIRIRLSHATRGGVLKYSSLVNTLCHELAHLKHFNHGKRFKKFYFEILEWARREGIYRPSPSPDEAPEQLDLFGG